MVVCSACRDIDALDPDMRYRKALSAGQTTSKRTNDLPLGLQFGMSRSDVLRELKADPKLEIVSGGARADYPIGALPGKASIAYRPGYGERSGQEKLLWLNFAIEYEPTDEAAEDDSVSAQKAFAVQVANQFRLDYPKTEFIAIPDPDFRRVIVQIDNNRRLEFFRKHRNLILGRFLDLSVLPNEPLRVEDHR